MSQRSRCWNMGIYWVAMWVVKPEKAKEHDSEALSRLLDHVRKVHPRVLSVRTWISPSFNERRKPNRILMQEYADYKSMGASDSREMTSECADIWEWIRTLMVPRSFRTMIWEDIKLPTGPIRDEIPLPFRNPKGKHGWI